MNQSTLRLRVAVLVAASCGMAALASAQKAEPEQAQTKPGTRNQQQAKQQDEDPKQAKQQMQRQQQSAPIAVDVDDLAEKPQAYFGKTVRVKGEVEEILGQRALTLDEDSFAATTDVLVLLPRDIAGLGDDADVTVTGQVMQFVHAQFERDYAGFDLQPDLAMRYDKRPVIVASAVRAKNGADLLAKEAPMQQSRAQAQTGANAQPNEMRKVAPISISPGAIARTPAKYYGRRVEVGGEIEDVFGNNVFTLDEDALFAGPDVLVITQRPAAAVTDGADVRVYGTVRPFSWAEIRRDFDWLDLDNELVVAFENRPVIVADSISRAYDE